MKKSLSLILSIALVFSMFSSLAFAADQTIGEKLKAAGVISGNSSGDLMEDQIWKREDLTVLAAKLLGVVEEAQAAGDTHEFEDVDNPYYDGFISYAKEAGIFLGVSETQFGMNRGITAKQFAAVILRVLGFEFNYDADTEALAIEHGIFPEGTNWLQPATRGDLYSALAAGIQVVGADGQTIAEKRNYVGFYEVSTERTISSFKAVGAKKLEVTFNGKVDPSKVEFSVKRDGSVAVNIADTKFANDNQSAVLELASSIVQGEYTVTVKGIAEEDVSKTVSTENEKVTKVELIGNVAGLTLNISNQIDGAKIGYRVFNQYGENVTDKTVAAGIRWFASLATSIDDDNKGVLEMKYPYLKDQTITITAIVTETNYTQTYQVTIGDRAVAKTIEVKELWHPNGKELLTSSTFSEFVLLLEVKDQYGAKVNAAKFNEEVIVTSNPAFVNVATDNNEPDAADNQGPDSNMVGLPLAAPNAGNLAGKSLITFIPRFGGEPVSFEINVVEAAKVANITISMPSGTVAVGDTGIEIPFTAVDQYNQAVTDFDTLDEQVTLGAGLYFEEDYVNNETKLKYNAPSVTKGIQVLMAIVPATGKSSSLNIDVKDARVPKVIANTKDLKRAFVEGASAGFGKGNIVIHDQYGAEYGFNEDIEVTVEVVDGSSDVISISDTVITNDDGITINTSKPGTKRIRTKLEVDGDAIAGSEYEFTVRVVNKNDVAEYVAADINPVYNASTHKVGLNVFGKMSDGAEVVVPHSIYSVTTTVYGLNYAGSQFDSTAVDFNGDANKDINGKAIIYVDAKGGITLTKDIVATNKARVIDSVKVNGLTNGVLLVKRSELNAGYLYGKFEAKDQYGVVLDIQRAHMAFSNVSNTNISKADGFYGGGSTAARISGAVAKDSFNVTLITGNGIITTVKVIVTEG